MPAVSPPRPDPPDPRAGAPGQPRRRAGRRGSSAVLAPGLPGLISVGHGTLDRAGLTSLLRDAGVEVVVDIRRFPGSRRDPEIGRDAMQVWAPEAGLAYRWDAGLGGRRRLPAGTDVVDTWWRVMQFAAYAAYTRTDAFGRSLEALLAEAAARRVAMMCSESVWWRCHRRLVADVAELRCDTAVFHLMHDGRLARHDPSEGARVAADGHVVWDG